MGAREIQPLSGLLSALHGCRLLGLLCSGELPQVSLLVRVECASARRPTRLDDATSLAQRALVPLDRPNHVLQSLLSPRRLERIVCPLRMRRDVTRTSLSIEGDKTENKNKEEEEEEEEEGEEKGEEEKEEEEEGEEGDPAIFWRHPGQLT